MARPSETPPDWVTQHEKELAQVSSGDPLSGLNFQMPELPKWMTQPFQGADQRLGKTVENLKNLPVAGFFVDKAIGGLGTAYDTTIKTPAGSVALNVDALTGGGLSGATQRRLREQGFNPDTVEGRAKGALLGPKTAADILFGEALPKIAEDPSSGVAQRVVARGTQEAERILGNLAPIAPGVGALRNFKGPADAAVDVAKLTERTAAEAVAQRAADRITTRTERSVSDAGTAKAQAAVANQADEVARRAAADDAVRQIAIKRMEDEGLVVPRTPSVPGAPSNVIQFPAPPSKTPLLARIAELQKQRADLPPAVPGVSAPDLVVRELPTPKQGPSGATPTFGFQIEKFPTEVQPFMQKLATDNAELLSTKTAPISWGETVQAAQEIGEPVADVAARLAKRGTTSAELEMVRQGVAIKSRQAMEVAQKVARGAATPEEKMRALLDLQEAAAIQGSLHEAASEAGRTLNILRKQVDEALSLGPTEAAYQSAISKIARTPEKADEFFNKLLAIDPSDTVSLGNLLRTMNKADFWQKFDEYYKSNLLWSPGTQEQNVSAGLFQQGLLMADLALTKPQRVPDYLVGMVGGYKAALDRIPSILGGAENADKWGAPSRGAIPGWKGELVRIPYKALAIEDAFQTAPMYNGLIRVAATEAAAKAGLKGPGIKSFIAGEAKAVSPRAQFIEKFLADPPIAAREAALKQAEQFALHGDSGFSKAVLNLPRGLRYLTGALFVKTPVESAKLGIRFSPLGLARPITDRIIGRKATPVTQALRESGVIGGATSVGFYYMLENGDMNGLYPKSKTEADAWKAQGREPMTIRASEYPILGPLLKAIYGDEAKDRWVTAALLGPLVWPAMLAASVRKATDDPSSQPAEEQVAMAAAAMGRTLLDQIPLFQGFKRVNDLLSDPTGAGVDYVSNLARGVIPAVTMLATAERFVDTLKRDPDGVYETLLAQVPGAATNVKTQQDVLGRDVPQDNSGWGALLPRSTIEREHPVIKEQERLASALGDSFTRLSKPTNDLGPVTLDPNQRHRYATILGGLNEDRLTALLDSPAYQKMSNIQKGKEWQKIKDAARTDAKKQLADEFIAAPEKPLQVKGIALGIATADTNYDKAKFVEKLLPKLSDPELAGEVQAELRGRLHTPEKPVQIKRILDGDTVDIGDQKTARLAGIDAPELNTPDGVKAAEALTQFLAGKTLTYQTESTDNFGRSLVVLKADGASVNDWLVQSGFAVTNRVGYDLDTYRKVIPLLAQVEKMPRFAKDDGTQIGDQAKWDQFDAERKQFAALTDPIAKTAFRNSHPVYREYASHSPQNPVKTKFIAAAEKQGIPLGKFLPPD